MFSVRYSYSSICKESQQFLQYFFRLLFRQVVSAVQRSPLNGCTRMLSPDLEHIPTLAHGTFLSPEREDWALYFSPCVLVFLIHIKIDVRGCPVILATRVDCFRRTEATLVLLQRLVRQRSGSAALQHEELFEKESGVCTDHVFWKRSLLNQKEPPHIFGGKLL